MARHPKAFGELAVPYVAELVKAGDPEIRYYAILVAAELPHPLLLEPLAAALFDEDPQGLSYRPDAITEEDAAFLRRVAHEAVQDWNDQASDDQ